MRGSSQAEGSLSVRQPSSLGLAGIAGVVSGKLGHIAKRSAKGIDRSSKGGSAPRSTEAAVRFVQAALCQLMTRPR